MDQDILSIPLYKGGSVSGECILPGSKSISNRLLLMAALSGQKVILENFLISEDTRYMAQALRSLGTEVDISESEQKVTVIGGGLPKGDAELFVGNAGTAMRFLTSYLALGNATFVIDGNERMRERPIRDLVDALRQFQGIKISYLKQDGYPPLRIETKGLQGNKVLISGKNSSQYVSSLMMIAPYLKDGLEIEILDGLSSKPYFEMTLRLMERFGVSVSRLRDGRYKILAGSYKMPERVRVEPDASSATYFMALPLLFGGEIKIPGLGKHSLQGDVAFASVLEKMGARVEFSDQHLLVAAGDGFEGVDVDMNAIPDTVPTLAVLALFAKGHTRIRNVANLRIKESDRLSALAAEIKKIGGNIKETPSGLEIFPKPHYNDGLIETYDDHRIAMSFFLVGLKTKGLALSNSGCVVKSFPKYYEKMGSFLNIEGFSI